MLTKIRHYLIRSFFFGLVVIFGIMLTGAVERGYQVVENPQEITEHASYTLDQLAAKFVPHVFVPEDISIQDLSDIKYEVVNENDGLTINYYYVWSGRKHPDYWQHIKNTFRDLIYFKFNTTDIQFIQVSVRKSDLVATLWKYENGTISYPSNQNRLYVADWTHAFSNVQLGNNQYKKSTLGPTLFTSSEYKNWKMARRSQGDYTTTENASNIPIIIFLALIATYYFRHLQKDYNKEYANA